MHFIPLHHEDQLAEARARFPLFYDACLPALPDPCSGLRYAVVGDSQNTVLALLRQAQPFHGPTAAVTLAALVLTARPGLTRLLGFLRRFIREMAPWVGQLHVNLRRAPVWLSPDLTIADVEEALRHHRFRVRADYESTTTAAQGDSSSRR